MRRLYYFFEPLRKKLHRIKVRDEVSLHELLRLVIIKLQREKLQERAESVAYNLTLATFPFIIFLFTLMPYVPIEALDENFFVEVERIFPTSVAQEINNTIQQILSKQQSGLRSFSFLAAMFLATNGMNAFISAFNRSYRLSDRRNYILKRLVALILTVVLFLVLSLALVLIVSGELILDALLNFEVLNQDIVYYSIDILRYVIVLIGFFISVMFMYYFAPAVRIHWRKLVPGALLATGLIMLFSVLFSYYITAFNTYNKVYGSIGTLLIYMIWIFAVSLVILLGFDLNVSIIQAYQQKTGTPDEELLKIKKRRL